MKSLLFLPKTGIEDIRKICQTLKTLDIFNCVYLQQQKMDTQTAINETR